MKALILKDNDAQELLTKLELIKHRMVDSRPESQKFENDAMYRSYHFEVVKWLQSHGFEVKRG